MIYIFHWCCNGCEHVKLAAPRKGKAYCKLTSPRDADSIPGSGRSPGVGNGNPLQYSCLENSTTEKPGRLQSMGWQSWTWPNDYVHMQPNWSGMRMHVVNETSQYKSTIIIFIYLTWIDMQKILIIIDRVL